MKKIISASALVFVLLSCNNESTGNDTGNDSAANAMENEKPKAMDSTTKHPDGTINGSVISTDTGSMIIDQSVADSIGKTTGKK